MAVDDHMFEKKVPPWHVTHTGLVFFITISIKKIITIIICYVLIKIDPF